MQPVPQSPCHCGRDEAQSRRSLPRSAQRSCRQPWGGSPSISQRLHKCPWTPRASLLNYRLWCHVIPQKCHMASWPPREGLTLQQSQDLSPSPRLTLQELLFVLYSLLTLYLLFLFPEKFLHPQPLPAGKTLLTLQDPHRPPHAAACSSRLLCWTPGGWWAPRSSPLQKPGREDRWEPPLPPSHRSPSLICNALIVDTGSSFSPLKPSPEACTSRKPSVLNLARCPRDTACSGLFMPQT